MLKRPAVIELDPKKRNSRVICLINPKLVEEPEPFSMGKPDGKFGFQGAAGFEPRRGATAQPQLPLLRHRRFLGNRYQRNRAGEPQFLLQSQHP
jgi:hypothetical protein